MLQLPFLSILYLVDKGKSFEPPINDPHLYFHRVESGSSLMTVALPPCLPLLDDCSVLISCILAFSLSLSGNSAVNSAGRHSDDHFPTQLVLLLPLKYERTRNWPKRSKQSFMCLRAYIPPSPDVCVVISGYGASSTVLRLRSDSLPWFRHRGCGVGGADEAIITLRTALQEDFVFD